MQDNNMDRHFTGMFNIGGEEIAGDLIYNIESGVTLGSFFISILLFCHAFHLQIRFVDGR
jgi:hypothetical protein